MRPGFQCDVEAGGLGARGLFHLSSDVLLSFLKAELSRHCVIRHDYGLYEYTTYVYREPNLWGA